jgi:hypothetical protein
MSKLIFPEHGGVLVRDDTKVVRTIDFKTLQGTYVIKVVGYSNYHRPYGYHYLAPDGSVSGSNSGNSYDPDEALERAVNSIKEDEKRAIAALRPASAKKNERFKRAVAFFKKHGGYSTRPGETKKKAIQNSAERLARAEQYGTDMGWTVTWDYDQEEYQLEDAEEAPPSEVLVAVLRNSDGSVIGSLGGIGDPDDNYKRVVEAELALEAMPGD